MKLLKRFSFFSLLFLMSIGLFIGFFSTQKSSSVYAANLGFEYENYLSITSNTALTTNNIKDNGNNTYSIIANNTICFIPNVFDYHFDISQSSLTNFSLSYSSPITLTEDIGEFNISYLGNTTTYYYEIKSNKLNIYTSELRSQSPSSLKLSDVDNNYDKAIRYNNLTREMTYITSIVCDLTQSSEYQMILKVYGKNSNRTITFNITKPITKFAHQEEPILKFNCTGIDAGNSQSGFNSTWLPSERIYKSVTIEFFKNYTQNNPLFFNINYNGFVYYYKIYTLDSQLFFEYIDEKASKTNTYSIFEGLLTELNPIDITFDKIGRYEIEVYDLTFDTSLTAQENINNNANYYSTSFYIYDNTKTYENIYFVAESLKNGEHLEYIVTSSTTTATLNNDIKVTFKNLYFLSESDFQKIKIVVTKTTYTASISSEKYTYTYDQSALMQQCYNNQTDFYLIFEDDARYNIALYYDNNATAFSSSNYDVVKQPKTLFQVGTEGDDYYDSYIETEPYKKTEKTYSVPLSSQIELNISYFNTDGIKVKDLAENSTFNKTYLNKFTIFFGISQINIERYTRIINEGNNKTEATTLDIKINAVGSATVTVSYNGKITNYFFEENENKILSFSDYGDYNIYVVDEMGTSASAYFSYQKSLNTSAILLIVLSLVIVLAIVIFIIISRARVQTR